MISLLSLKLTDRHIAKLASISLSIKKGPATSKFPGPIGPRSTMGAAPRSRKATSPTSKLRHCEAGPIPRVTERSTRLDVNARTSVQG